ncbi:sulfide/dihydroorotate dehydrogenase-like FAD/NAD-binding protein [Thermodesulforhabdus norvegica]|uniref:Ferredoxin--NADP+ reductase n=1 Tax=Thermodesulforhabdus norvegica TaxID=39841 RepID=A0A1I4W154_9BACT|nr:sulfide/dihydroorotate dehydrogenase-like FAD/NAD-binding protein [Thermodesulforhabdus norvegica]SFN07222.1 ferredoxin--NADP+ reductase [Thermodesulforhabdus norvegica]
MYRIVKKEILAPNIVFMEIEAPDVARSARPGQFVMLRVDEKGERFPLSIADWNREAGTVSIAFFVVGKSTTKLACLHEGDSILNLAGPLGIPTPVRHYGRVICAGGCFGIGPAVSVSRALREAGNRVTAVMEVRSREFVFWEDKFRAVSDEFILASGSGLCGDERWANNILDELLRRGEKVDRVFVYGCPFMMMKCAEATRPYGIKTSVSLTPIMVDGTGMCGACRVEVGGETRFACVDGPEFDGHAVNWDLLIMSQRRFLREEYLSMNLWERENWHRMMEMRHHGRAEKEAQSESCSHA